MKLRRLAVLTYGGICYLLFLASFVYLVLFLADAPYLPRTVNRGPIVEWRTALGLDLALIALFGLQHSAMARRGFKGWITRRMPLAMERPTYVLMTVVALVILFVGWRPLPTSLFSLSGFPAYAAMTTFWAGIALILVSTFVIDHFELFGLKQVFEHWKRRAVSKPAFRISPLHRIVRHPLYVGWILTFFATPHLTHGHLLFAVGMTAYILVAIPLEERDLALEHGEPYVDYRKRTPALLPRVLAPIIANPRRAPPRGPHER
jgi:methanethiol S-methyltransferase